MKRPAQRTLAPRPASGQGERGAVSTIVAVLLAGGVIMGFLALSVDVGNIMWERRQVQNGADAAAMAVASACGSKDVVNCTPTSGAATQMNNANAADGTTATDLICARGVATIAGCPSTGATANLGDCPALPAYYATGAGAALPYVEVHSGTRTAGGGTILPGFISKAITGSASTVHVPACARAVWGPAAGGSVLPLAFSECEWKQATSNGTVYGVETALGVNYDTTKAPCANYNGHDYSGGFGWLQHPSGVCHVEPDVNDWVPGWPGNGTGNDCLPNVNVGDTIYIPIYDCINDSQVFCPNSTVSSKTNYHLRGGAAFLVTAIDLTGKSQGTPGVVAKKECQDETNNKQCLYGKFVKDLRPIGEIDPTAPNYGLTVVQPMG